MSVTTTPPPSASAFAPLSGDRPFGPLRVEGELPEAISGALYRVGPARFRAGDHAYQHWFDGDGAVTGVKLSGGRAEGGVRFVQTPSVVAEQQQGRILHPNYGTVMPGNPLKRMRARPKNAANTATMIWQDRLFALNEGAVPAELDPDTLATRGETRFDGEVRQTFSAHPHWVAERQCGFNFGLSYGRKTALDLYALPARGPVRRFARVPLPRASLIHDFIATPNYLIFLIPPLRLRLMPLLMGRSGFADSMTWEPELGTEVLVVPIDHPGDYCSFTTDAFYQWHFGHAYEIGHEIKADLVSYPDFTTHKDVNRIFHGETPEGPFGAFTRATIDVQRRRLTTEDLGGPGCEFPQTAPLDGAGEHRYTFLATLDGSDRGGNELFRHLGKFDHARGEMTQHELPEGCYPSEPVLVPKPDRSANEDAVYVLTLVNDVNQERTSLAVLDGEHMDAEARAYAHFDAMIPPTLHGCWQGSH